MVSKIGITLSLLYFLITVTSIAMGLKAGNDFKGRFVFLQVPIALQMSLIDTLVHRFKLKVPLEKLSWFWAYVLLWIPTICLLYICGWWIEHFIF